MHVRFGLAAAADMASAVELQQKARQLYEAARTTVDPVTRQELLMRTAFCLREAHKLERGQAIQPAGPKREGNTQ